MHWIIASLLSALFIGIYDLFSKHAVHNNAVLPMLFHCTLWSAAIWTLLLLVQILFPGWLPAMFVTQSLTAWQHLLIAFKSLIVSFAWTFTYFGIKHLPVSLSSPIRSTAPLWTLAGALVILAERPSVMQSLGIVTTLISFFGLSLAGRREGVHFHRDKWVGFLVLGTLFNSASAVYDKYLLGTLHFSVATVQAWFSIYLWLLFVPVAIGWKRRWWSRNEFHWRWSIPLVAITLLVADFLYFGALRYPAALVSVVISLRRGSTLISFAGAILFFHETAGKQKLAAVVGILIGILLTVLG
jgi:drug/metabolite transporter (DMT)-like permease